MYSLVTERLIEIEIVQWMMKQAHRVSYCTVKRLKGLIEVGFAQWSVRGGSHRLVLYSEETEHAHRC